MNWAFTLGSRFFPSRVAEKSEHEPLAESVFRVAIYPELAFAVRCLAARFLATCFNEFAGSRSKILNSKPQIQNFMVKPLKTAPARQAYLSEDEPPKGRLPP